MKNQIFMSLLRKGIEQITKSVIMKQIKSKGIALIPDGIEFDAETNEFFEHAYKDFLEGKYILEGESKYPRRYENINQIEISDEERNKFLEKCGIKVEE
ncbi:hypothetical protein [Campylobacter phage CP81]|uniref:Uncharacterized protein n=3 Tax=Fletchervirus TaxID=1636618 RepID=G8GIZ6_9CAUD|nr:hypothetical protein CaPhCPX_gp084 [Campylobacter phage CPX]YP_009623302.1 hypothetical protein FDJ37_gp076 [Campylobacter phage CP81]AET34381.1 hypothetical protein [Campylobacter phage CPX]AGS81254.1 hypothetical protein [Campylobacter phage CP8]CBZ42243.1 hypothetical protein [Campylobacter phage CP81]